MKTEGQIYRYIEELEIAIEKLKAMCGDSKELRDKTLAPYRSAINALLWVVEDDFEEWF